MRTMNHETRSLFASFLTGVTLAVVLGLMVVLSTPALAMGGGGGGSAPAPTPAPEITKVDDPVAKLGDEVAEVKKLVVEPGNGVPDDKTPVGELRTKEPEEKRLAIEDPDEDKTENKPDERTIKLPKPEVVEATVDFAVPFSQVIKGVRGNLQITISNPLPVPLTLTLFEAASEDGEDKIINFSSDILTFQPGETSKVVSFTVRDTENRYESAIVFLEGDLPEGVTLGAHNFHFITVLDTSNRPTTGIDEKLGEEEPEVAGKPDDAADGDKAVDTGDETGKDVEDKTVNKPDFAKATVEFSASSPAEAREGDIVHLILTLSRYFPQEVTLSLHRGVVGTASVDDFTLPGTVTFPRETTTATVALTVLDDTVAETDETIVVTLTGGLLPDGVVVGTKNTHTVIVLANDQNTGGVKEPEKETPDVVEEEGKISIVNGEHVRRIDFSDCYDKSSTILIENLGIVDHEIDLLCRNSSADISIKNAIQGIVDRISLLSDGRTSIENWGTVGRRISAFHYGGEISIANHGTVNSSIKAGFFSGDGEISIVNHGTVNSLIEASHSADGGISIVNHGTSGFTRATHDGDGEISIANRGTVNSSIKASHSGDGGISIANHGTVNRWVEVRHFDDGGISIANHGTVRYMRASHFGDGGISIANHGTVNRRVEVRHFGDGEISIVNQGVAGEVRARHFGDNGILRFSGNVRGEWNKLAGELIYVKSVVFSGDEDSRLNIDGDYNASSDTQLSFYVDSNGWGDDRLTIEGDVAGQSRVALVVPDTLPSSVTANSDTLIEVEGNAQADNFVGEETVGAYRYVLEHRGGSKYHTWRFFNRGLSDTAKKTSQIADELSDNIETPPTNDPDKKTKLGLWGEQDGSHTTMGLNALAVRLMGGDMVVGTSMSRNFSTSNNVNVESQITALAANWERKGFYAGGQTRYARFTSDVSTDRLSVVRDNEGTGVDASVDLGYRFALPFGGVDFQVAQRAQLVWSRVNFDDFVGPHGELVLLEDGELLTGYLGLSWDGEWQGAEGFGRIYGGMNLRGAVDGKTSVNVSGISIANERRGLSVDGKLGLSYEWDEGHAVYGEVSALRDGDANEVRADLGVRIDF